MGRLADAWHALTEGHSLGYLWNDFKREARSSIELSVPEPGMRGARGWRRYWLFARAMFFRLSPARRLLVLLALLLLFSYRTSGDPSSPNDSAGRVILAALVLLMVLALEVADRVALKRDLELARDIQNWLVPHSPPDLAGLDIAFGTLPANTVAGDYYDVVPMPAAGPGRAELFVVADVAGKGIPAGLLMACFRSCLRTLASTARELSEIVGPLHRSCCADSHDGRNFTTAFVAQYASATGSLSYVNAGHNPPLLRRGPGVITQLEIGGLPFGAFAEASYEIGRLSIGPGDLLVIYTDGVVEAVNEAGNEYGLDRLRAMVSEEATSAANLLQRLLASIAEFSGKARRHDDITCLIVRFTG